MEWRARRRCVASAMTAALACASVPAVVQAEPDVLARPALMSKRAETSVLLSVARAGDHIVAVGERGIIVLSDDNGMTWRQAKVPVSVSLTNVRFVDAKHGWAVGHGGVVLRSDDGGETWVRQLDGQSAAQALLAAAKARDPGAGVDAEKAVANAERLVAEGPSKPFLDVAFFNARQGLIVGAFGLVFATEDGGKTWIPALDRIDNPQGKHLYGVQSAGDQHYMVGEQGAVFRATDGAMRFTPVATPYAGSYFGVIAGPSGKLVVYGLRGNVYWSDDAGAHWEKSQLATGSTISAGLRLSSGALVLLDDSGRVLASNDGGRSFAPLPIPQSQPYTGAVQAADGALVLSGVRGMTRIASGDLQKAR